MSSRPTAAYETLARLLEYPSAEFGGHLASCSSLLREACPTAAAHFDAFAAATGSQSTEALEELFIQTFDFNPKCTLDLGWQLFAEDYNRGLFLAKLRAESRRLGVAETCELPDHLPHVLRLIARMEPAEAADFTATCVLPAVEKTLAAMSETNPYRHLVQSVFTLLGTAEGQKTEAALT